MSSENFSVSAIQEREQREEVDDEKMTLAQKRDREVQKSIDKSNMAFAKVSAERAKNDAKLDAKREAEMAEAQKRPYLTKIQSYLDTFPFLSEKLGPAVKVTTRTSLPELVYTLGVIRHEMDTRRSLNRLVSGMDTGILMLEGIWGDGSVLAKRGVPPHLCWNLTGMYGMWKEGAFMEDVLPLLQEIDIEYPWLGKQSLPLRALSTAVGIMAKVNMKNTPRVADLMSQPPKDVKVDLPDEREH